MLPNLNEVIAHVRERQYMSGVERDKLRVKATGEVFSPTELVQEVLDTLPQDLFKDPAADFLDPACGDGQFLGEVLIRKMENGIDFKTALSEIYGVDLMPDNVELCRERLLCGREELRDIVIKNIVCANGLEYDYSFNGTNFTDKELREQKFGIPEVSKTKKNKSKKIKTKPIDNPAFFC
jgi:SAM-dependent methyltransferase